MRVSSEWSLSCWLRTPLEAPRSGGGGIYTLASADGHGAAECHVQVRASADGGAARLGVFAASPASPHAPGWHPLNDENLQRLPAGWHSLVAVGGGDATAFYINGRACGEVHAQARSAIARLGGGLSALTGAALRLADVRLYGAALAPRAVRELHSNPHPSSTLTLTLALARARARVLTLTLTLTLSRCGSSTLARAWLLASVGSVLTRRACGPRPRRGRRQRWRRRRRRRWRWR